MPVVRGRDLHKRYHGGDAPMVVLDGVNIDLAEGELVVVRGASGSGKTTLLNMLGALDRVDSGELRILDQDLGPMDGDGMTRLRAQHIGFVFQFHNLIPSLTAEENVLCGLHSARPQRKGDVELARQALAQVGLAGLHMRFPSRLSGGQQQRVAIARALVKQPQLLLADEPTGSLDEATGGAVLELLAQIRRASRTAVVLVTHNPALDRYADRVLHMRAGRLVAAGG
jgi:putative ABC transport system ATP-binding protein